MTVMGKYSNSDAFFALVRAGLWEEEVQLSRFNHLDFKEIYRQGKEQSVMGLVAAGVDHTSDIKIPQEAVMQFVKSAVKLECRNKEMNQFVRVLIEKLNKQGIETLLIKGQGLAQCYERPLWRAAGDVDLFLYDANYEKAKAFLAGIASSMEREGKYTKHIGMSIGPWKVELHGYMRANVTAKMDRVIDAVQKETFDNHRFRIWKNNGVDILLPEVNDDVFYVFTHFLHHFYRGGVRLKQVCDWCRLLAVYNEQIDRQLLLSRLNKASILPEWRLLGQFAVKYLGMPEQHMPFYEAPSKKDLKKVEYIKRFILKAGDFGLNREHVYGKHYPFLIRKLISLWRKGIDTFHHFSIFPVNSFRFFFHFFSVGLKSAAKGV